jgi:hypothetical protein
MMLSMTKALLDGTPLLGFEDFKVATPAEKVTISKSKPRRRPV